MTLSKVLSSKCLLAVQNNIFNKPLWATKSLKLIHEMLIICVPNSIPRHILMKTSSASLHAVANMASKYCRVVSSNKLRFLGHNLPNKNGDASARDP
jgi:hypothetical protein